jgi:hypothetical protein
MKTPQVRATWNKGDGSPDITATYTRNTWASRKKMIHEHGGSIVSVVYGIVGRAVKQGKIQLRFHVPKDDGSYDIIPLGPWIKVAA